MLVDATHWLIAFLIALSVHLAGLLWFEPVAQSAPKTLDLSSETIVVRLGPASGSSTPSAALLSRPTEIEQVVPVETVDTDRPTNVPEHTEDIDRSIEAVTAPPPVRRTLDMEALVTPESKGVETIAPEGETTAVQATVTAKPLMTADQTDTQAIEVIVTRPLAEKQTEVVISSPAPTEKHDSTVNITETVTAAPLVNQANEVQDSSPVLKQVRSPADSDIVTQTEVTPTEVKPDRPQVAETETESVSLAAVVVDLDEVDEVAVREKSETITRSPESTRAVAAPIREQTARAVTLEELLGGSGVSARYAGLLKGWLQENMHYPRAARLAGQEGRATVRFVIDRNGKVLSIRLEQGSGHRVLDREAVEMIERADPFPAMPAEMLASDLELRVPIVFEIRDESLIRQIPPIYLE